MAACTHPHWGAVSPGNMGGIPRGWQCLSCRILVTMGDMMVLGRVDDLAFELQSLGRRLDRLAEVLGEITERLEGESSE